MDPFGNELFGGMGWIIGFVIVASVVGVVLKIAFHLWIAQTFIRQLSSLYTQTYQPQVDDFMTLLRRLQGMSLPQVRQHLPEAEEAFERVNETYESLRKRRSNRLTMRNGGQGNKAHPLRERLS